MVPKSPLRLLPNQGPCCLCPRYAPAWVTECRPLAASRCVHRAPLPGAAWTRACTLTSLLVPPDRRGHVLSLPSCLSVPLLFLLHRFRPPTRFPASRVPPAALPVGGVHGGRLLGFVSPPRGWPRSGHLPLPPAPPTHRYPPASPPSGAGRPHRACHGPGGPHQVTGGRLRPRRGGRSRPGRQQLGSLPSAEPGTWRLPQPRTAVTGGDQLTPKRLP